MGRSSCLAAFVLLTSMPASGWAKTEVLKTRSGSMVHWDETEMTIGIDHSAPSRTVAPDGVRRAIHGAIAAWNEIGGTAPRLRFVTGADFQVRLRFCRGKWTGDPHELGRTEFIADIRSGTVTSATIELNECDRYFAAPDEEGDERFDIQAVLAHELGHVLGLSHGDNPASLMYPTGGSAGVRTPHADDRMALATIYGWVPPPRQAALPDQPAAPASEPAPTGQPGQTSPANPAPAGPPTATSAVPLSAPTRSTPLRPPPNVLSVVRISGADGRDVLVYTCEPNLLPALVPVESGPPPQPRKARKPHRRAKP